MKRISCMTALVLACGLALALGAENAELVNGMKVVCEDGVCRLVDAPAPKAAADSHDAAAAKIEPTRIAQGYMPAKDFITFLDGDASSAILPSSLLLLPFLRVDRPPGSQPGGMSKINAPQVPAEHCELYQNRRARIKRGGEKVEWWKSG